VACDEFDNISRKEMDGINKQDHKRKVNRPKLVLRTSVSPS